MTGLIIGVIALITLYVGLKLLGLLVRAITNPKKKSIEERGLKSRQDPPPLPAAVPIKTGP